MRLANPWALFCLLLLIPLWWRYLRRQGAVAFPSILVLKGLRPSPLRRLRHAPFVCRCLALIFMVIAFARPQAGAVKTERTADGLDIMLVLDTSGSMRAQDYVIQNEPVTRIELVRRVTADFIKDRNEDRIGLVVFGSEAFTQAPLTLDHEVLAGFLDRVDAGVAGDATAIGDGLATAVNRLRPVQAKEKIAILLTDGGNNSGRVDPLAAAQAAKAMGVKVYTIGFGSAAGEVPIVVNGRTQMMRADLDEAVCKQIAEITGGTYFRAADTETLISVYETIDKLEKTKVKVDSFSIYEERYATFLALALIALAAELAFSLSRYRRVP